MSEAFTDPHDTPEYQAFVEDVSKHCRCSPPFQRPCDGCLAGGVCDDLGNGPASMVEAEREEELD